MSNLWDIVLIVIMFVSMVVYDHISVDDVDIDDFELVENFTSDLVGDMIGDTSYCFNIDVTYVGKRDGFDIYKTFVDSLPNGLKSIEFKIGLTEENRDFYILNN